jgi:hypothetical protein
VISRARKTKAGRSEPVSNKDEAAEAVEERWFDFQKALSDRRKYPSSEFNAYAQAVRRYVELTRDDPLFHKKVVCEINGLTESLSLERKRVPDSVIVEAQRLECLVFSGYDPYFEGDEPPGF